MHKKLLIASLPIWAFGSFAQSLMNIRADSGIVYSGQATTVTLEMAGTDQSRKPWCGLNIRFGDGAATDKRVEDVGRPISVTHTYATPGTYQINVEGKTMFRGLSTANACEGGAKTVTVTVLDYAERLRADAARDERARRAEDAARQREIDAKRQALEAREAELRTREADLKAQELRRREAALKIREEELQRRGDARQRPIAAPVAAPPAAPPAKRDPGTLDVFK